MEAHQITREEFLTRDEVQIEKVTFDDGNYTFVREMYSNEKDQFEQSLVEEKKQEDGTITYERALANFRAKLAVNTVCDESGVNILAPDDYNRLGKSMGAKKMEKIVAKAQELNKITDADKDALVKNSVAGQTGDSPSDCVQE